MPRSWVRCSAPPGAARAPPPPATPRHATPRHATPRHATRSQCARAAKGGSHQGEASRHSFARGPLVAAQVYQFLGLSVGLIQAGMTPAERRKAYACDVKYVTNQELGFDFLRDNLAMTTDEVPSRALHLHTANPGPVDPSPRPPSPAPAPKPSPRPQAQPQPLLLGGFARAQLLRGGRGRQRAH